MRYVYVLMFLDAGRAMVATATRKRQALRHARRMQATVYAVPVASWRQPGGWDCPTIRATFDPIYRPAV